MYVLHLAKSHLKNTESIRIYINLSGIRWKLMRWFRPYVLTNWSVEKKTCSCYMWWALTLERGEPQSQMWITLTNCRIHHIPSTLALSRCCCFSFVFYCRSCSPYKNDYWQKFFSWLLVFITKKHYVNSCRVYHLWVNHDRSPTWTNVLW